MSKTHIKLTGAEIQSNHDRVRSAENLIKDLPNHGGRNTWLLNYGIGEKAQKLRKERGLLWDEDTQACETIKSGK